MITLVEKYKPRKLAEFIGMKIPRAILAQFLKAPYETAFLFVGDAGLGKTSMAFAAAEQLGGQVHHFASRQCDLESVDKLRYSCQLVPMFGHKWHVPIIDEADKMTIPAQLSFLSMLDGTSEMPNTIFFFTANDTKGLEPRFLSRCKILKFTATGIDGDLASFLAAVYKKEAKGKPPDLSSIVQESGGNIRHALNMLETALLAKQAGVELEAKDCSFDPRTSTAVASSDAPSSDITEIRRAAAKLAWARHGKKWRKQKAAQRGAASRNTHKRRRAA